LQPEWSKFISSKCICLPELKRPVVDEKYMWCSGNYLAEGHGKRNDEEH
jgi:hypothetical protein